MKDTGCRLVLTTCPNAEAAARIAEALVTERLAACVNILPDIGSRYRWRGRIESDTEQLLLIKCTAERYGALESRIRALHPYELPEIIAVPIVDGLPDYLAWLREPK